jgi:hypothetical protein
MRIVGLLAGREPSTRTGYGEEQEALPKRHGQPADAMRACPAGSP